MKRKVIITKLPQAGSGLDMKMQGLKAGQGLNLKAAAWFTTPGRMSEPDIQVNRTLKAIPRSKANVEVEDGEIISTPGEGGIPNVFKASGERHSGGGIPLNLPKDSFVFSDTNAMKIKDPEILAQFGITTTSSMTPAGIAKKYDVNKWKGILADPDTDDIQRKTAEMMISNYNLKLAKLGLVQESKKGFPQGIPQVAMPYIESLQINPDDMVDMNPGSGGTSQMMDNMAEYGGFLQKGGTPPQKVEPYNTAFFEALKKKGYSEKQLKDALPSYLFDANGKINSAEYVKAVDQLQGLRKGEGTQNIWGKYNWKDPSYYKDFERRHQWYLKDNPDFNPEDKAQVAKFQNAYNKKAKEYGLPEYFGQKGSKSKFQVDELFGQNTYSAPSLNETPAPAKPGEPTVAAPADKPIVNTPVATTAQHIVPQLRAPQETPWWIQDIIKTGNAAANYMGVKKYNPWQASEAVFTPEVTFKDPTRELAANSERLNIGANTMAQFTGPQAFNARFNQMSGQSAGTAADILGRYNNDNIQISNGQSAQNAAIMNDYSQRKAFGNTSLYDKYTIANQQFDNSRSQARDVLVNQFVQGITNKNYTANLNKMNPQFAVDPLRGGEFYFHNPKELDGKYNPQRTADQYYEDMLETHPTWKGSDVGMKMAWDAAKLKAGVKSNAFDDYRDNQVINSQAYPGQ